MLAQAFAEMKLGCNEIIKLGHIVARAKLHADGSLFCLADDCGGLGKVTPMVIQEHVEVLSSIFYHGHPAFAKLHADGSLFCLADDWRGCCAITAMTSINHSWA